MGETEELAPTFVSNSCMEWTTLSGAGLRMNMRWCEIRVVCSYGTVGSSRVSLEELGLNAEIIFLFGLQLGQSFSGPKIVDENYVRGRLVLETVGFTVRPCLIPTLCPLTLCLHVAKVISTALYEIHMSAILCDIKGLIVVVIRNNPVRSDTHIVPELGS